MQLFHVSLTESDVFLIRDALADSKFHLTPDSESGPSRRMNHAKVSALHESFKNAARLGRFTGDA